MRVLALLLLAFGNSQAASYFLTIAGLGGAPEYQAQFKDLAAAMERNLKRNGHDCHVQTLTGADAAKDRIKSQFAQLAQTVQPDDAFALMLIGHGTYDGTEYKFNIPGPDVTASELAELLGTVRAERQLVVDMTSASGAALPALAKKGRIVITATKSGTEKNVTVFARYWLEAMQNSAADTDKNGTVSALEAFRYAENRTAAYFQNAKLLATEHPQIDDTGSKQGVRDPTTASGQGLQAAAFPLIRPPVETAAVASGKQKLIAKKEQLEAAIDRLKYQKAAMPNDDYKRQLSALLLELAQTQAEIDR
jgi:hypothetical protein